MEARQLRLKIVEPKKEFPNYETGQTITGAEILKQMKTNNVWRVDHIGRYCGVQFDGQMFMFREGEVTTVPETVGRHLRRQSVLCIGSDKLNGPMLPFLEVVDSFDMTEPKPSTPGKFACPICGEDQKNPAALARHLGLERKKHPELFEEDKKKTDWEGPQGGTLDETEE